MANKQIVDYINGAQGSNLKKGEIISNLKQAGWADDDIREAYNYVGLYSGEPNPPFGKPVQKPAARPGSARVKWISFAAAVLGYVWLVSGLNKILGNQFAGGFGDYVKNQIDNGSAPIFYKNFLASVVLPNAQVAAVMIQYSELVIGAALVLFGIWNFLRPSKLAVYFLTLASLASLVMILNIILSLGLPFPWLETSNAFAPGVSLEYLVLFLSALSAAAHFSEI